MVIAPDAAGPVTVVLDAQVSDGAVVQAVPAVPGCTADEIAAARKQAQAQLDAGRFAEAIALLHDDSSCYLRFDQDEALQAQIAWRISDRAFAHYKAGDYASCYDLAAGQLSPHSGNVGSIFDETTRVVRALSHNAELCQAAVDKRRGPFAPAISCAIGRNGGYGVPASVLGADEQACLHISPDGKDADGMLDCGDIVLVRKPRSGKLERTVLTVATGNIVDPSLCCNVQSVRFAKRAASFAVLVVTDGRDCNGGTASSEEQHVYELRGSKLELVDTLNAVRH